MTLDLETIKARYEILDEPDASEMLRMEPEQQSFVIHACRDIPGLIAEIERLQRLIAPTVQVRSGKVVELETEIERLRMILSQNGAAYLPCQNCHKNVATPTLESILGPLYT